METQQRPKASWVYAHSAQINQISFTAKASSKGFIGFFGPDQKGNDRYLFGMDYNTACEVLGNEHPVIIKAGELRGKNQTDRKLAKEASRELVKHAMTKPELLAQIKALLDKKAA